MLVYCSYIVAWQFHASFMPVGANGRLQFQAPVSHRSFTPSFTPQFRGSSDSRRETILELFGSPMRRRFAPSGGMTEQWAGLVPGLGEEKPL